MVRHIFVYHAISDGWEPSASTVSKRRFREQCSALAGEGWLALPLETAFADGQSSEIASERGSFCLTVDDANVSLATIVVPECDRHGWRGTAFVPTAHVGGDGSWDVGAIHKHRHADWSALRDVAAAGWEIGSHGVSHCALTDVPAAVAERELSESRDVLQQRLGRRVVSLAYPFGATSARVAQLARRAGYERAVIMAPGPVPPDYDPLRLPRWPVYRIDGPANLAMRLAGPGWAEALERARTWAIQRFSYGTRVRMAWRRHVERTDDSRDD